MILQVKDVIKDAMGLIGAIEMDEVPSSSEMLTAMRTANIMLGRWSSQHLLLRSPTTVSVPLVSGQTSYTIGLGITDVVMFKPLALRSGFIRSSSTDSPCTVIPYQQYQEFSIKDTSSEPAYVSYNAGNEQQVSHTGTLYFYPTPNEGDTFIGEFDCYINELVDLTDILLFEPAYYEAFIYNLAVRLYRRHHPAGEIPSDIVAIATNSLQGLRTMNSTQVKAHSDFVCGRYNVYTDGY